MGVGEPPEEPGPDAAPTDAESTDTEELLEEIERKRSLGGIAAIVVSAVAILFSLFQMILAARSFTVRFTLPLLGEVELFALQQLQANVVHVSFALVLAFLLFPGTDGTGAVARRLGALADAVAGLGPAARRAVEPVRGAVRWFAVDPNRDRVTPADLVLVVLTLTSPVYFLQEFDEISSVLRILGLEGGRPIGEVYPILRAPAAALTAVGLPLDASYALLLGTVGVLLVLEATRRALGTFLAGLVASFIAYAYFGHFIPRDAALVGIFSIPQLSWANVVRNLWFTSQGVFGIPVTVSVRFIFIFILFGAFLETSGAGRWFIDFAYALTGSRRGGPAKASVVSSGFMGMLSGSSIANTVTTGAFTIPLMKRSGYSPEFAGGVEASSSSGGQILPPVMGAAAFLIVEYTGTPYGEVIVAAAVPAIAFFFGMWVMVHFEAARHGIGGVDRSTLPRVGDLLRRGWFYLVPIVLLLYYLVIRRLSVGRSGWYTIVAVVALVALVAAWSRGTRVPLLAGIGLGFLAQAAALAVAGVGVAGLVTGAAGTPLSPVAALREAVSSLDVIVLVVSVGVLLVRPGVESRLLELDDSVDDTAEAVAGRVGRPGLADNQAYRFVTFIVQSMDSGARTATTVVVAVAAAGVIPGVISVSGLGPNLTSLIVTLSGGSLVLTLLIAGVAALILGLGMPTTVMYILLIATLGGALEGLGVPILAAHLFVLYFGLMADVTPPVAVAAYAAAGVAKADEWGTGRIAFLLSLNKILVPFAFVFSPGILLLRRTEGEAVLLTLADLSDPVYLLSEVVVPIVGMFVGIWALGVAIIGFYDDEVPTVGRVGYALASLLLMVPALLLSPAAAGLGLVGLDLVAYTTTTDVLARFAGAGLLAVLLFGTVREDDRVVA
ncbi:TRAP transporter permease [Halorarum salinum]|uniref:TRAP transporter permease n=1 Tax=Halorarum salinum TaxID=2743089 RepID=A0A7D5L8J2_9EURY|nr:TRAP transporter fused permease subunit [Halobaculum salinum]QLG60490.1 TRAP transporter permease [Halobaculum salinum]